MIKSFVNWSSGKDAMLSMHITKQTGDCYIDSLISTVSLKDENLPIHYTPLHLIRKQANSLNCKLILINMPQQSTNNEYKKRLTNTYNKMFRNNYKYAVNGDIHLTDVRSFKEQIINDTGLKAIFPLWKKSTKDLALQFIDLGYKAIVVSVDLNVLDKSFSGRLFDKDFLNDLPQDVDPCGENGEFHTFCFDGPLFSYPIPFTKLLTKAITTPQQGSAGQLPQYYVQYIE